MDGPHRVSKTGQPPVVNRLRRRAAQPAGFEAALDRLVNERKPVRQGEPATTGVWSSGTVELSKHARARLESRGLTVDAAEQGRLDRAVEVLAEKGSKEALVLTDQHAFVVGVPKRVVITAMGRSEAVGQVFTGIDSTFVTDG